MGMVRLAVVITCALALGACSDGGDSVAPRAEPGPACPSDLEQLSSQVFQSSCVDAGCHGSGDRAGGLDLETSALELELFGRESALCGGETRIIAGDGDGSLLVMKLRGTACGARMPIDGTVADATVDCISAWIDQLDPSSACETCGGDACIDLRTDAQNCGTCNQVCPSTATCVDGACTCPGGLDECGSGCTDLSSDPANCGACGDGCGDLFCLAGECSADCGALANCSGACIDIMTDSRNCGTCGADCGPGASCVAGMCQCGSETVSFAGDVQPIFNASCASAGCHDGGPGRPGPMGGKSSLDLTDGSSFASLLNATTNCGPVVVPGDPEGSLLIGKLTGLALCTGSQMPKGDPPLADNLIDTIATWICQGAEDN